MDGGFYTQVLEYHKNVNLISKLRSLIVEET
jgi:hypothetical protein